MKQRAPLVIFALDSANIEFLEAWSESGFLPNIQSIIADGQMMTMGGPGVFDEIGAWLTAFSGVTQYEHGYFSSRRIKPGTYELQISKFEDAGVTPFWAVANGKHLKSAILDLPEPTTFSGVRGIQLAGLNAHQETYAFQHTWSEPPELAKSVIAAMGNYKVEHFDNYKKPPKHYIQLKNHSLEMMRSRGKCLRALLAKEAFDFIGIGFNETHDVGHIVWPADEALGPETSLDKPAWQGIKDTYMQIDNQIGEYLKQFPENSNIMIISTYGIKDQYPTAELGEALIDRLQYRVKPSNRDKSWTLLKSLRALVPETVRHYLSQYFPRALQQWLVRERFSEDYDFAKSKIYTVPSIFSNWIRVNLKGRDPKGIVPPEEYATLLDELEKSMREIKDPTTGESAISAVLRPNESPLVNKMQSEAPDMVVHWRSSKHFLSKVDHPTGQLRQRKPHFLRNTFHRFPGFMIWKGPDAEAGYRGKCSITDFAPTCMDLLGISPPAELTGRSLKK